MFNCCRLQSILLEFVRDVLEDPGCTVDIEESPLYAVQAVSDSDPRPTIDHLNFFVVLAQLLPLPSCDQPQLQSQASGVCSTGKYHKEEKIVIPGVTDGVNLLETHAAALSLLTVLSAGLACASRTACVPLRSVLATGSPLVAFCLSCLDARRRLVEARRFEQMHRRKAKAGSHGTIDNRRPSSASRSTLGTSRGPTTVSTTAYLTASPSPTPSTAAAVLTLDADDKADGKGKSVPKAAPSTQNSSGNSSSSITSHEELPSEGDRTQTITTEGETQEHEGKVDDDDEEAEDDDDEVDEVDEDGGAVRAEETAVSAAALNVSPEVAEVTKDLTKLALQVLGNLMYGCKAAQDELRERSGLPLVLSHCGTDFENPLAREWALLCIRNACEGNEDNQRYIDSLKPQSVIKDDATLSRHGLSMEIDPQSGKFKLHQSLGHLPKGASSTVDSSGTNTDTGKEVEGGQGEAPPLNDFRKLASGALAGRNIPHRDDRENGVFADN
jgi:hypothetical protein